MALLSNLNKAAKTIGDSTVSAARSARKKTLDMISINRLNKKVAAEYDRIDELKETIAGYVWSKYASGQPMDEHELRYCEEIQKAKQGIGQMLAQIDAIRNDQSPQLLLAPGVDWVCMDCGAQNAAGTKFCGGCGKCVVE